jgi:succinate dehydrogenase / fumarate reductase cytochrome b subunit
MSIAGRMVGIGLAGTMMAVCLWFIAAIFYPEIYSQTQELLAMPLVKYLLLAWAFAIFFYIGNGVRHFLWIIGLGVNQKAGILTGNIVLVLSVLATAGLWHVTMNKSVIGQETVIEESVNE